MTLGSHSEIRLVSMCQTLVFLPFICVPVPEISLCDRLTERGTTQRFFQPSLAREVSRLAQGCPPQGLTLPEAQDRLIPVVLPVLGTMLFLYPQKEGGPSLFPAVFCRGVGLEVTMKLIPSVRSPLSSGLLHVPPGSSPR